MKKIKCFDISHRRDVVRECKGSPTLCARMGTGGNNVPIVLMDQGGLAIVRSEAIPINTMLALGRPSDKGRLGTGIGKAGQPQNTLSATHCHAVCFNRAVRKLTPVECERLQGFPDNYTQIPYRGKSAENCPDAPRYKALGNSWAVPVVRWIGERINIALKVL